MTGYTKGPWVADKFGDIDGPNGEPIATTDGVPGIEDVAGANARRSPPRRICTRPLKSFVSGRGLAG
jgi:hypothetical protein